MELAGNADGTLIELMTVGKLRKTTDKTVELGGTLEAEMPKTLMPKELEMIARESGQVSINGWDIRGILFDVRAVSFERLGATVVNTRAERRGRGLLSSGRTEKRSGVKKTTVEGGGNANILRGTLTMA